MRLLPAAILLSAALAGCSTVSLQPAPVVSTRATPVGPAMPTAAAASAPAPTVVPPGYYRVQRGDTLRSIARKVGRGWHDLVAWNQLSDPNRIEVGQLLRVAPPGAASAASTAAAQAAAAPASSAAQTFPLAPQPGSEPAPAAAASARTGASTPAPAPAPHAAASRAAGAAASAPREPVAPASAATAHAGALSWSWPAAGKILRGFNGNTSKGVDIAGREGEAVRAAADGKVVYAGNELRGFGNLVIIKHNTEYISVYAHNQKILVKDGQAVRRGETIALMGSTDAPRVELHFEVRLRGKPIDPEQVLPRH